MNDFLKLQELLTQAQTDHDKFMSGNSAAGTRLRKKMQEIKKAAQEVRNEVTARKKGDR